MSISPVLFDLEVESIYSYSGSQTFKNTFFISLERLYLVSNKISKIENLDCCPKLNMLELGDNKIRKVGYISFVELKSYSILPSVSTLIIHC